MTGVRPFPFSLTAVICGGAVCFCARLAVGQGNPPAAQQGVGEAAAASAQVQGGDFKIQVGVNSVLVPVVVRDAHGRVVGDLTQKDFQLFDQDKARTIVGFTVQKRGTTETLAPKTENGTAPAAPPPSITM